MGIKMNEFNEHGFQVVQLDDEFQFTCSQCGECCRNVKDAVMVESLDLYNIAKFFNKNITEIIEQYTVPAMLSRGFAIFLLKTKDHMDICVFLKNGRCSIHQAKPRVCRLYPLGAWPDDKNNGEFISLIVSKRKFHFNGQRHFVKEWMRNNLTQADKKFLLAESTLAKQFGKVMNKIDSRDDDNIINLMLIARYLSFNTELDFQEQYLLNNQILLDELKKLMI